MFVQLALLKHILLQCRLMLAVDLLLELFKERVRDLLYGLARISTHINRALLQLDHLVSHLAQQRPLIFIFRLD